MLGKTSFCEKLESRGFKQLGAGAFSAVYAHPQSDRVIKVGRADNWLAYILWATENGYAGNFAPKVYSFRVVRNELGRPRRYCAVMERALYVTHHTTGTLAYKHGCNFSKAFDGRRSGGELSPETESTYPGIRDFGKALQSWATSKKLWLDLNFGNIMFRQNGSICIIDPVTGELEFDIPDRMRSLEMEALSLMPTVSDLFA